MTAQPIHEPDPHPAQILHVVPDIPGRLVPDGAVAIPVADYERIRRRVIFQQIRENTERAKRGDFSGFTQVTAEEIAAGELA